MLSKPQARTFTLVIETPTPARDEMIVLENIICNTRVIDTSSSSTGLAPLISSVITVGCALTDMHMQIKRHICPTCGRVYRFKSLLLRHSPSHSRKTRISARKFQLRSGVSIRRRPKVHKHMPFSRVRKAKVFSAPSPAEATGRVQFGFIGELGREARIKENQLLAINTVNLWRSAQISSGAIQSGPSVNPAVSDEWLPVNEIQSKCLNGNLIEPPQQESEDLVLIRSSARLASLPPKYMAENSEEDDEPLVLPERTSREGSVASDKWTPTRSKRRHPVYESGSEDESDAMANSPTGTSFESSPLTAVERGALDPGLIGLCPSTSSGYRRTA